MSGSSRATRLGVAALLVLASMSALVTGATGQETLSDLKSRMRGIQAELDKSTKRIEELRSEEDAVLSRIGSAEARIEKLKKKSQRLQKRVVAAADALYRSGSSDFLEVLLGAEDLSDFTNKAELLSQVSQRDQASLVAFSRTRAELAAVSEVLAEDKAKLAEKRSALSKEVQQLQARFGAVSAEYEALEKKLAARRARAAEAAAAASTASTAPAPQPAAVPKPSGNMTCPIAGPHSFTDTWGAPRSGGRSHQGVDMMANYGTPVVAITSGTITFAGYGGSAGNWQVLTGNDGHQYWYMHNQNNLVGGGTSVKVGQQIATVGDTGNATGIPHLHFEYHPGGGSAVNPTPLVSGLCSGG